MKRLMLSAMLQVLLLFICYGGARAAALRADPDFIATGVEFRGVPAVKIGDDIMFGRFSLGGMVEVRNEERFNQGALPNHNWRGFFSASYVLPVFSRGIHSGAIDTGFEHESAHPTSGLYEPATDPYQMIYDGTYRNINMNSILLRYCHTIRDSYMLKFTIHPRLYFLSRNTPELPYTDYGWSGGVSCGAEYSLPLSGSWDVFLSVFDRYIFRGSAESRRDVYFGKDGEIVSRNVLYPVINDTNTASVKSGVTYHGDGGGVEVSVYGSFIYGNIYGFVDSRDRRTQYAIGIELVH